MVAAILRAAIEIGAFLSVVMRPEHAVEIRGWLERFGLVALYVGAPVWQLFRIFGS